MSRVRREYLDPRVHVLFYRGRGKSNAVINRNKALCATTRGFSAESARVYIYTRERNFHQEEEEVFHAHSLSAVVVCIGDFRGRAIDRVDFCRRDIEELNCGTTFFVRNR